VGLIFCLPRAGLFQLSAEFAREIFMELLSNGQFIEQLAHGEACRSLGGSLIKTHRLRLHQLNLLSHLLNTQHFGEPRRFPAKEPLDVMSLDKGNVLSELRAPGIHESLGMHQFFVLHRLSIFAVSG
jgi:hypothetical protein